VHQTKCKIDGIWHLKTEPCPACKNRDPPSEKADQTDTAQSNERSATQSERDTKRVDEIVEKACEKFLERLSKQLAKKHDGSHGEERA